MIKTLIEKERQESTERMIQVGKHITDIIMELPPPGGKIVIFGNKKLNRIIDSLVEIDHLCDKQIEINTAD